MNRSPRSHKLRYTSEAIESCVKFASQYITDRFLPDKAIDVLDETGARVRLRESQVLPEEAKEAQVELRETQERKEDAVRNQNYELAAELKEKEGELRAKVKAALQEARKGIAEVEYNAKRDPSDIVTEKGMKEKAERAADPNAEDDDDEDTEELMRELQKIKREREAEEALQKADRDKMAERERREEVMKGNPLLMSENLSLKRKWDDDTVFKNQAKTAPKQKQRYINDSVRSDFHKKFLNKYVWVDGIAH
mmetsp:Transcript_84161/g.216662  ORF Transcript_84161/g.216662 Transcript_84161/m.216662 type:complete len:252 (+) Transcript_84161:700-1455(+)